MAKHNKKVEVEAVEFIKEDKVEEQQEVIEAVEEVIVEEQPIVEEVKIEEKPVKVEKTIKVAEPKKTRIIAIETDCGLVTKVEEY